MSSSFRLSGWDPILITSQMVALQALYYLVLSLLLFIAVNLSGLPMTMDAIFRTESVQPDNVFGWTLGLVWLFTAVVLIPVLVLVVQRARLVLDFVLTLHGCHLVFCWVYERHFPWTLSWWIVQGLAALLMTLGGEWACMRYEMKPILLMGGGAGTQHARPVMAEQHRIDDDDLDEGNTSASANKMPKRKVSDAEKVDRTAEQGPLTEAVGKARQVIIDKSQHLWTSHANDYETIPMANMPSTSN
ncbi:integral membrane protein S linking to the trans Golgi network-domain-containing protein [Gongronella butleri]|nr:integral membrane protein S linking to the trans Golgi network-domain-containing protein [Gongronella butleri]